MNTTVKHFLALGLFCASLMSNAQTFKVFTTTETDNWVAADKVSMKTKSSVSPILVVSGTEEGTEFRAWGTTFNELDWDAFNLLTRVEQDEVMFNLFDPNGDLHFTHGRVSMNANDYARSWYSCSEVAGDFELRYFNIERDKRNIIPLARAAQKYCPQLQLFMSPWSPPAWMKINQDYPVLSSRHNNLDPRKDYLLYVDDGKSNNPDEM